MNPRQSHKFNADSLGARLEEAGIRLEPAALAKLWRYHELLRKADAELNLTRIRNFDAMVRKHYVDSLIVLDVLAREGIELPAPLIDVGTGAGFPGVPLAIARPGLAIILVEGRGRRVDFLKSVVAELALPNVSVVGQRLFGGNPGPGGSIITRAVARMEDTIERTAAARSRGDLYIFMKGPNCDDEIGAVQTAGAHDLVADAHYVLPDSEDRRRLVVWSCRAAGSPAALPITSVDNHLLKTARSLWRGRMIRKHGRALVLGRRLVEEVLRRGTPKVEVLLLPFSTGLPAARADVATDKNVIALVDPQRVRTVLSGLLSAIDEIGTGGPVLVVQVSDLPWLDPNDEAADLSGLTVCLPLGDPENLGAAIRSCAALGAARVLLTDEAAHPYHPRAIRASAGACFTIPLFRGPALAVLQSLRTPILALDRGGRDVASVPFPADMLLVVGEEGGGIPPTLAAERLGIPIAEGIESLNGAVALSIALDHIRRRKERSVP